jgi:large subunit ribosomal protein L15
MPLAKRIPKTGFFFCKIKPYVINVERVKAVAELSEIIMEIIRSVHKVANSISKIKLVGASVKDLAGKIKDENVTVTGK